MDSVKKLTKISILITTFNRCVILKQCLDSLLKQDYPKELLEIIVLDDASSDATAKEIPVYLENARNKYSCAVSFLQNRENKGIIYGRWLLGNKFSATSEMILFLDDDAYLEDEHTLSLLTNYILDNPKTGIIGPRFVYEDNPLKTAHSANFINPWTARYKSKESNSPLSCDWLHSICLLTTKDAFTKTGGFWPNYYVAHAEVDFCLRVKNNGFQVIYYPGVKVRHAEKVHPIKRERLYYLYRNKLLLVHRNFPFFRKFLASTLITLFGLPIYLAESINYHKGFDFVELGLIVLSVWHGLIRREGPLKYK
jgi:GT2 family glycosyltransferase